MFMTAVHMDSSSTTTTTPPPWLPVFADHHHQLLHDFTASASPSPPTPPSNHHRSLPRAAPAPAARRVAKRRPRPSRRLPTTYISAEPASFRRMVHQLTGADDLPLPLPQQPADAEILLSRPAPVRPAGGGAALMNTLLPTLDTSAFLVGALARTQTDAPSCDASVGSTAAELALELEAGGDVGGACCNETTFGGFPTLESWDHALF